MKSESKDFKCVICGKSEIVSKYSTKKLCADCNAIKRRARGREHDKKRRPTPITQIECAECKIKFSHSGRGAKPKYCSPCRANYSQTYESTRRTRGPVNPTLRLNVILKHRYGISRDRYLALFESQDGCCVVCGVSPLAGKVLYVDHDHACCPGEKSCGRCVRGLICQACNSALGQARDDITILKAMETYLKQGGVKKSPNAERLKKLKKGNSQAR